ncbi:MAG: RNA polymerase sigma factor [Planctomycetota bacterium]
MTDPSGIGDAGAKSKDKGLSGRDDTDLMTLIATYGDPKAFEVLLKRHQRAVLNICFGFMRDHNLAEDMTQEVFLRVYRGAASYKPVAKFTTWLYRITANLCLNELKKNSIRRTRSLTEPTGPDPESTRLIEKIAASDEIPLTQAERHELRAILDKAIAALPAEQAATLILVENRHLPYEEVARIMNVTVSAIKMRIKRARTSLREALKILDNKGSI